jgi:hypothetical protein
MRTALDTILNSVKSREVMSTGWVGEGKESWEDELAFAGHDMVE